MFAHPRNVKNQRLLDCSIHPVAASRRRRPYWRAGAVAALLWLLLAPCLPAAIQDRREAVALESQRYRAQHFPDGHMPPKHGWRQPSSPQAGGTGSKETPGGVGYGYYFYNADLLWTNSSIADYYVVAPTNLGGNVTTLYLTSTCRAQLGTESLIAYEYSNGDPQLWIFDWSQYPANPWQVFLDLPPSPQYLTMRPDEFAVTRQMVHVRNGTYYLGFTNGLYNWQNQTLLFDFVRGDWDYIYSRSYTTTSLAANLPQAGGESTGFWGPIVETFQTYTNINAIGYDLIRLFQDGNANPSWLTPANSYNYQSTDGGIAATTNWNLLTQATNTSFTVAVGTNSQAGGSYNMGSLCVTANTNAACFSLSPSAGAISPYWIITPNSNRWDKTVVGLPPGAYTITFSSVSGLAAPAQQVFTIATNSITTVQAVYETLPVWQSATLLGQTLTCIWSAPSNSSYQLQCTANLAKTNWTNLGSPIASVNGRVTTTNSITSPQGFYRLRLSP
jgi:hypothetical protein